MAEKSGDRVARYHKEHIRQIKFNFNKEHDKDILDFLDSLPNRQGYIKNLIRHDMRSGTMRGEASPVTGDEYPVSDE